jgi:hypothetical protein
MVRILILLTACVGTSAMAGARDFRKPVTLVAPPPASRVEFRLGAAQDAAGAGVEMCLQVSPIKSVAIEGCGTGAGYLFAHADRPDVAHFRGRLFGRTFAGLGGWLEPVVHVGLAELEIGEDEPGFMFTGVGANGHETAGPEAGVALRWRRKLAGGFAWQAELTGNLAYFAYADRLVQAQPTWLPSLSLTMGVGW